MRVEMNKKGRIILAGALIGTVVGALGAVLFYQGNGKGDSGIVKEGQEEFSVGHFVSLVWHSFGLIRDIAAFGRGEQ
jgi:ABC-type Co2+ transport system permease subunit